MPDDTTALKNTKLCENCHTPTSGAFCSQCGQSVEPTLKYFWTVILHLLDDLFSFDSRASRTLLPLVFKPGFLTLKYFSGHRVHYVPPLRLYLFISIVFFLSIKVVGNMDSDYLIHFPKYSETISIVENELADLKEKQRSAGIEESTVIEANIVKFEQFLKNLQEKDQYILKAYTDSLIELELIQKDRALTADEIEASTSLNNKIKAVQAGEPISPNKSIFRIGNQEDGSFGFSFLAEESNNSLQESLKSIESKVLDAIQNNPKKLLDFAFDKLPQVMFILLPVFALLLKIIYLFKKRLYLEHLTVALHSHSFIFISFLIAEVLILINDNIKVEWLSGMFEYLLFGVFIWIPLYLYLMQKRVYQQSHIITLINFTIVSSIYVILITTTSLVAFIWGVAAS